MSAADSGDAMALIRRYAPMVYGPTAMYSIGQGAIVPVLPALAADVGADLAGASLVVAALVLGQLFGNLPAGWLVSRIGERLTMLGATVASLLGIATMYFAPFYGVLAIGALFVGFCAAAFAVARHAFMTIRVPYVARARALALVGGAFRLGTFTGPFIAAGLIGIFRDEHVTLLFFAGVMVLAGLLVAFGPDPERKVAATARPEPTVSEAIDAPDPLPPADEPKHPRTGVMRMAWRHRDVLSHMGIAAAGLAGVRAARTALLPVWGVAIGIDTQTLALIIGIAGAIEFSLFYASGQLMDRFGRLWSSVPALLLMAGGFIGLAFTRDLDTAVEWFIALTIIIAIGNGLSSGILLTLGADLAPPDNPAPFLGAWRTMTDGGGATTPLAISAITAVASISFASGFVGVVGLLAAGAFLRWVPRYVPKRAA